MEKYRSFGKLIKMIQLLGKSYIDDKLSKFGIGYGQFHILQTLYKFDCTTQHDIVQHLGTSESTTARTIRKLVEKGYIERKRNPKNRRAYSIELTEKGKSIRDEIYDILKSWTDHLTRGFTDEENNYAYEFLERMYENAKIALEEVDC